MKKLLAFALVLGVTAFANAGLFINVDGSFISGNQLIVSFGSYDISVGVTAGTVKRSIGFILELDNDIGSFSYDHAALDTTYVSMRVPTGPDTYFDVPSLYAQPLIYQAKTASKVQVEGAMGLTADATQVTEEVLLSGLTYTYSGRCFNKLMISTNIDGAGWSLARTITIFPEPTTMSLLGLGGLALIRRRRA